MIAVISGRDREAFPEFYAEYDARVLAVARSAGRPIVTAPLVYTGQAELQRDIANLKAGLARSKDVTGFLPVVAPASALPNARNEYYRDEESFLFARRGLSVPSTARSSTPGSTSAPAQGSALRQRLCVGRDLSGTRHRHRARASSRRCRRHAASLGRD
jgi:hypothetical protein